MAETNMVGGLDAKPRQGLSCSETCGLTKGQSNQEVKDK